VNCSDNVLEVTDLFRLHFIPSEAIASKNLGDTLCVTPAMGTRRNGLIMYYGNYKKRSSTYASAASYHPREALLARTRFSPWCAATLQPRPATLSRDSGRPGVAAPGVFGQKIFSHL
jgi:hypothetical protein